LKSAKPQLVVESQSLEILVTSVFRVEGITYWAQRRVEVVVELDIGRVKPNGLLKTALQFVVKLHAHVPPGRIVAPSRHCGEALGEGLARGDELVRGDELATSDELSNGDELASGDKLAIGDELTTSDELAMTLDENNGEELAGLATHLPVQPPV
jgi:hypothetical protein